MIDDRAKRSFEEQGYVVARSLFDAEETAGLRDHFTQLREAGAYPGDVVGVEPSSDDPLRKYPRMIHMHRWDAVALDWLIAPRGARGQAVHHDQYGPCGEWVDRDGRPAIELTGVALDPRTTE